MRSAAEVVGRFGFPRMAIALAVLALPPGAAGCLGTHTLGSYESAEESRCCFSGLTGTKVDSCPDEASCSCAPELCGAGSACQVAEDCPVLSIPCRVCADGTSRCPTVDCITGRCVAMIPTACEYVPACDKVEDCPLPDACIQCADGTSACYEARCNHGSCELSAPTCATQQCNPAAVGPATPCPAPPVSCVQCDDGTERCASNDCINGQCRVTYPTCPPPAAECTVDGNCPQSGAPCVTCWDGTAACPKSWCEGGVCKSAFPQCPPTPECKVDADCSVPDGFLCGPACCKAVCTPLLQCQVTIVTCPTTGS